MQAIKIDYFDNHGDNQDAENKGKLYARNCITNLVFAGNHLVDAVEMLLGDIADCEIAGVSFISPPFQHGFKVELCFVLEEWLTASVCHLNRCHAKPSVPHPQDANFIATHKDSTVPPRFRKKD
jgi:hypothetical protein